MMRVLLPFSLRLAYLAPGSTGALAGRIRVVSR